MGMTGLATPSNENASRSRVRIFKDLLVFPEEANFGIERLRGKEFRIWLFQTDDPGFGW
jgi:hypothetical protein